MQYPNNIWVKKPGTVILISVKMTKHTIKIKKQLLDQEGV